MINFIIILLNSLAFNTHDCIPFRYEELFDLNPVVIHAIVLGKESDNKGVTYKLKTKNLFKETLIEEIRVSGKFELKIGEEIIYWGNLIPRRKGQFSRGILGYPCISELVIKEKSGKRFRKKDKRAKVISKHKFEMIIELLKTKKKASNSILYAYLDKDPFLFSNNRISSLKRRQKIYKDDQLIIVKVYIDRKGNLNKYEFMSKIDNKVKKAINSNIKLSKWRFMETNQEFSTIYPLIYSKSKRNSTDF